VASDHNVHDWFIGEWRWIDRQARHTIRPPAPHRCYPK
jgi:hypothetical protein